MVLIMKSPEIEITNGEVTKVFKALASATRWKILKLLEDIFVLICL